MANNPHIPTKEQRATVLALATYGITHKEIASYLGIVDMTLQKWYKSELAEGRAEANVGVRKFLFNAASGRALKPDSELKGATFGDCLRAAMFWGKTQMGMRETDRPEEEKEPKDILKQIAEGLPD